MKEDLKANRRNKKSINLTYFAEKLKIKER